MRFFGLTLFNFLRLHSNKVYRINERYPCKCRVISVVHNYYLRAHLILDSPNVLNGLYINNTRL